jgi:hypothetical protein
MAEHKSLTVDTKVQVYFCDPRSLWQRGTNENTNGLLRQYFPKKIDLSAYSEADLDKVALQLKQRPRNTLKEIGEIGVRRLGSRRLGSEIGVRRLGSDETITQSELRLTVRESQSQGFGASLDAPEDSMLPKTLLPGA